MYSTNHNPDENRGHHLTAGIDYPRADLGKRTGEGTDHDANRAVSDVENGHRARVTDQERARNGGPPRTDDGDDHADDTERSHEADTFARPDTDDRRGGRSVTERIRRALQTGRSTRPRPDDNTGPARPAAEPSDPGAEHDDYLARTDPDRHGVARLRPPERVLVWISGYDRTLLATTGERYRAICAGVLVLLISALAAFGVTILLWTIFGGFRIWFVAVAAGWAVVVFWVDRSILVEPHYGNMNAIDAEADRRAAEADAELGTPWPPHPGEPDPARRRGFGLPRFGGSGLPRAGVYLSRVLLALAIAFLVGEALVLAVLNPEVMSVWNETAEQQYNDQLRVLAGKQVDGVQREIDGANDRLGAERKRLTDAEAAVVETRRIYLDELRGTGGTFVPGSGPETTDARQKYDDALAAEVRIRGEVEKNEPDLIAKVATLTRKRDDLRQGALGSPAMDELAAGPDGRALYDRTHARPGWLAQEQALEVYLSRQHSWFVLALPWVIRVLLLSVDLLPLSLKLLTPQTIVGRRVRDQARAVRFHDRRRLRSWLRYVDHRAALEDYIDALTVRLDYDNRSTYYRTRTDHLNARSTTNGHDTSR